MNQTIRIISIALLAIFYSTVSQASVPEPPPSDPPPPPASVSPPDMSNMDQDGTFYISVPPGPDYGHIGCSDMTVTAYGHNSQQYFSPSPAVSCSGGAANFYNLPIDTYTIEARADMMNWEASKPWFGETVLNMVMTVNPFPNITLIAPTNGAVHTVNTAVQLAANASDNGTIDRVEFYVNGSKVNQDSSSPYQINWTPTSAGSYSVYAKVYDNHGAAQQSATRSFTANAVPTVSLTSPANNAVIIPGTAVTLNATASDSDGSVSKVEFFLNGSLYSTDTSSPYSVTWSSPGSAGNHSWYARVSDNHGVSQSTPVRAIILQYDVPGPTGPISITHTNAGAGSYRINWGAASGTVHAYYLEERVNGGSWATIYSGGARWSYDVSNKSQGTAYEYRARACNPQYCGNYNAVKLFGFTGVTGQLAFNSFAAEGTAMRVAWAPAPGAVSQYEVQRSINGGSSWTTFGNISTNYLDQSSLTPGVTYHYRARACYSFGCGAYSSNTPSYIAAARPGAISGSAINASARSFTVNWGAASGAHYYQLQRSTNNGSSWGSLVTVSGTSQSQSSLSNGTTYTFRVRACNAYDACGPFTAYGHIRLPYASPSVPSSLGASNINRENGSFQIDWGSGGDNAHEYQLYESANGGSTWTQVLDANAMSYVLTGRNGGTTYRYKVRACNVDACSDYTNDYSVYLPYATPGAPGAISGSNINATGGSFVVNWGAASGPAHRYELEQSTNGGASYTQTASTSATSYTATGRVNGTNYQYRVRACNNDNVCSAYTSAVTIRLPYTKPGAPGALSASGLNRDSGAYTLNWGAASGEVGWYKLEESSNGGSTWTLAFSGMSLSFPFSGQSSGTTYQYRVKACNVDHQGNACGPYTAVYSFYLPYATPSTPGVPSSSNVNASAQTIAVSWGASSGPAHRYELQQSSGGGWATMYGGPATGYEVSNLVNGTDYTYRVRACNNDNACSVYSSTRVIRLPFTTPAAPSAPSISVNDTAGTLSVSWTKPAGVVSSYRLQRSDNGGSSWQDAVDTGGTSFAPSNLSGGTSYHYRVQACNVDYCSAFSTANQAYLPYAQPPQPNLSSTGNQSGNVYGAGWKGEYTVSWSSAGGVVTGFDTEEQEPGQNWVDFAAAAGTPLQRFYNKPPNMSGVIQSYNYRAQACNSDNCSSHREITVQVKPYPLPGVPASLQLISDPTTTGVYTIGWSRPEGTADLHFYILEETKPDNSVNTVYIDHVCSRDAEGNCLLNPADPDGPYLDEQLSYTRDYTGGTSGENYQYRVRACFGDLHDHSGCDDYSAPLQVSIPYPPPSAISDFSYTDLDATMGSFTLTWTAATGQVEYHKLEESTDAGASWSQAVSVFGTSHALSDKTNGTNYRYRISACNNDDCGPTETVDVRMPYLAPGTPGVVDVSNISASTASYSLSWSAAIGEVTEYQLQESSDGGSTWSAAIISSDTHHAVTGKTNGATYHYRVRACNTDVCGDYSTVASVRLPYDNPEPPGVVIADSLDSVNGTVDLSWSIANGQVDYYELERRLDAQPWVGVYSGDQTSTRLTGISNGLDYQYQVRACNVDRCSSYSEAQSIRLPFAVPGTPGSAVASAIDPAAASYILSWSAASGHITRYELEESGDGGTSWGAATVVNDTSYNMSSKTNGATYHYRTRACNIDACGGYSTVASVRLPYATPTIPGIVIADSLDPAIGAIALSWSAATGQVDAYQLQEMDPSEPVWVDVYAGAATGTTLSNRSGGATYQYRVRACNSDSCGDYSAVQSLRLPFAAPSVPGGIIAEEIDPISQRLTLSWSAANGEVARYELRESPSGASTWSKVYDGIVLRAELHNRTPGQSYDYQVRACNIDACSSYTPIATIRLPYSAPGIPTVLDSEVDIDAGSFTLSWTAASGEVNEYKVQYSTNGGASWYAPQTTTLATMQFTGLTRGNAYTLRTRACNADACSAYSETHQVYLPHTAPAAPASLTVTDLDAANGTFDVTWTLVEGIVSHYELEEQVDKSGFQTLYSGIGDHYLLTDKSFDTQYNYRVRACNADKCSDYTDTTVWIPYPAPGVPGDIQISDRDADLARYTVSWTRASGHVEYYELQRYGANATPPGWQTIYEEGLGLSYLVTGLAPGASDQYRVRACNKDSCSAFTATATATAPLPTPEPPTAVQIVSEPGCDIAISVEWTPASPSNRFEVQEQRLDTVADNWQTLMVNGTASSLERILESNNNYRYRVRARTYSGGQYSNWSDWAVSGDHTTATCGYIARPPLSITGEYWAGDYSVKERTNGGAWIEKEAMGADLIDGVGWVFEGAKAKQNGVYEYKFKVCQGGPQPEDPITCWDSIDTVTVLRDPDYSGSLVAQNDGQPLPVAPDGSVFLLPDDTFTLSWPQATVASPATYHYELQMQSDLSNDWVDLDLSLSSTSKQISVADYSVPYNYRVRACASLNGYTNCGRYLELALPVILQMGPPRANEGYDPDREFVIYNKKVPIQWLPPLNLLEIDDVHHYEIWLEGALLATTTPTSPLVQQALVDVDDGGQKVFEIRACGAADQRSCGESLAFDITVIVPPEAPDIPAGIVGEPHPDTDGTPFNGVLSGKFSVAPNGAATYELPIIAPPGTAGVQPSVALSYNSQSANGVAGWGWSISGLSMITRCNKTMAQDGELHTVDFSDNDALCLDGQRLIEVDSNGERASSSTGMFRTEINDFRRITRKTGGVCDVWFEVRTQANETIEYGNTADACLNSSKGVKAWAQNKVTDVKGNYIEYQYHEDDTSGEFDVARIGYTGHTPSNALPYTWINFEYESRPDPIAGYQGGVKYQQLKRLVAITTDAGRYDLYYLANEGYDPTSRLDQIEYCAIDPQTGMADQCMQPLSFEWSTVNAGWERLASRFEPPELFAGEYGRSLGGYVVDLDQDGLSDVLYYPEGGEVAAYRNSGDGWVAWPLFNPPALASPSGIVTGNPSDVGVRFLDINGDGRSDLLISRRVVPAKESCQQQEPPAPYIESMAYENTPAGWIDRSASWVSPAGFVDQKSHLSCGKAGGSGRVTVKYEPGGLVAADLDNDGLTDLVNFRDGRRQAWRNTGHDSPRWQEWPEFEPLVNFVREDGVTLGGQLTDINGDGFLDAVAGGTDGVYLNTGIGWQLSSQYQAPNFVRFDFAGSEDPIDLGYRLRDINGDGLVDLNGAINTGSGWDGDLNMVVPPYVDHTGRDLGNALIDVNADGVADAIWVDQRMVQLNNVNGYIREDIFAIPEPLAQGDYVQTGYEEWQSIWYDAGTRFIDMDGDGRLDLIRGAEGHPKSAWRNASDRRRIIAFIDGFDNTTEVKYKVLTDKSLDGRHEPIYTPPSEVDTPRSQHMPLPLSVVDRVTVPDGIGATLTTEYAYQGLIGTLDGRGLQGFEKMIVISPNKQWSITEYAQDFPYSGMPTEVEVRYDGKQGKLLNRTETKYCFMLDAEITSSVSNDPSTNCDEFDNTQVNGPVFVHPMITTVTSRQLDSYMEDAGVETVAETKNTYGAFGYLKHAMVTTNGDTHTYTTETTNTYLGGDWYWLGRLDTAEVTKIEDGAADENSTRKTQFQYDPSSGLLTKEIVEPGEGAPTELHTAHAYDDYGNTTIITVCASDFNNCSAGVQNTNSDGEPYRTTETSYMPVAPDAQHPNGRFPVSSTNSLGHAETSRFDHPLGLRTELTGPNGITTRWHYDGLGRKLSETLLADTSAAYENHWHYREVTSGYVPLAEYFVESSPAGAAPMRVYYDAQARELQTLSQSLHGQYVAIDTRYDHFGRTLQTSAPYFARGTQGNIYWTVNYYDDLGRVTAIDVPLGDIDGNQGDDGVATSTTDYAGFITIATDSKGRRKQTKVNALGQTEQVIDDLDGLAIVIDYDYDSQGQLTTTKVDNNAATAVTIHYDARGNKKDMSDPDMGNWEYQYNGFGELIWQKDAKGQITEIDYDELGRTTERREYAVGSNEAQVSTWVYDAASGAGIGKLHIESGSVGTSKTYAYNAQGRLISTDYHLGMGAMMADFQVSQQYDAIGRIDSMTYPRVGTDNLVVKNTYSPFGPLWYVLDTANTPNDDSDDSVYWIAEEVDARGQLKKQLLRNRNSINQLYNGATGWLQKVESWDLNVDMIQQTRYGYDAVGNMNFRERFKPYIVEAVETGDGTYQTAVFESNQENVDEQFAYDSLDRITSAVVTRDGNQVSSKVYGYDRLGNIDYKDSLTNTYVYNHNGGSCTAGEGATERPAGPHAVCEANGHTDYEYDANGNMIRGGGRTIDYTVFNKPETISDSSTGRTVNFYYGADRSRMFKIASPDDNNQREYTFYIGLGPSGGTIYEQKAIVDINDNIVRREHISFIYAGGHHGGHAFAMQVVEELENTDPGEPNLVQYKGTEYYHRDHLGSVIAITDDLGTINDPQGKLRAHLMSFDAFGKRRNPDWSEDPPSDPQLGENPYTDVRANLGYTGQESVPEVGLIHMNGRVYDPVLGRFLSPDSFIQAPDNSQSYNRYSYVINNPIKYADPSGHFWEAVIFAMVTSFATTYIKTGSFEAAFESAVISGMFAAISAGAADAIGTAFDPGPVCLAPGAAARLALTKALVHGLVQGALSAAFNDDFRGGFVGSFIGDLTGPYVPRGPIAGTIVSAVIGGTVSALSGGKFRNGAKSAAIVHLFNHLNHGPFHRDPKEGDENITGIPEVVLEGQKTKETKITYEKDTIWYGDADLFIPASPDNYRIGFGAGLPDPRPGNGGFPVGPEIGIDFFDWNVEAEIFTIYEIETTTITYHEYLRARNTLNGKIMDWVRHRTITEINKTKLGTYSRVNGRVGEYIDTMKLSVPYPAPLIK